MNTQQNFEQLNDRAVAVVVDPIQSVKGKVVIDAFRLINHQFIMMGQEPRQTTSNIGHLTKPSLSVRIYSCLFFFWVFRDLLILDFRLRFTVWIVNTTPLPFPIERTNWRNACCLI